VRHWGGGVGYGGGIITAVYDGGNAASRPPKVDKKAALYAVIRRR
jgi:hypothetical protein